MLLWRPGQTYLAAHPPPSAVLAQIHLDVVVQRVCMPAKGPPSLHAPARLSTGSWFKALQLICHATY